MPRATVRPYLIASAESVSVENHPWTILADGTRYPADQLRSFLRRSDIIELEASLSVDVDELLASTGLDESASLDVLFLWECRPTRRREVGARHPIHRGTENYSGVFGIETTSLGGDLVLERQIILAEPPTAPAGFAATHPASMLWKEPTPQRVDLEGIGGILPTDLAPFRDEADPEAVWVLRSHMTELNTPATSSVKLILNENHADIRYIVANERWDDRARAVMSTIHWDVGRSLVELALEHDDFDMDAEYMDDSIGRSLQLLIAAIFGDTSPGSLRELRTQRPVEYQTTLQAGLGLLRGRRYRRYSTSPGPKPGSDGRDGGTASARAPVAETDPGAAIAEPATYKQIKMIVGLSGEWLGENAIHTHAKYPQSPLTKTEAHLLIDLLKEIPDGASSAKQKRAAVVDKYLAQRQARL